MATFPESFNRPLFQSILRMSIQNLKFVVIALAVPEIIGVPVLKNFEQSLDTPTLPIL